MKAKVVITVLLFIGVIFSHSGIALENSNFDIIIKNGKIINGTGNPWFYGDVGIKGDLIAAIGNLESQKAKKVIDASGLVITPGFIDVHTHCDTGLGNQETQANLNYLSQGVTTVVGGNCGYGTHKVQEITTVWNKQGIGTNAILLVGFGTVRQQVLGTEDRAPTQEELKKMQSIARKAMEEGAWGISTGLQYIPGRYASTEEIISLVKIVAEYKGIYSTHMRSEEEELVQAVQEAIRIGEESGVRTNIAHFKASGKMNWGSMLEAVKRVEEARSRGLEITADMYPYSKSATMPLLGIFHIPKGMAPFSEIEKKAQSKKLTKGEREAITKLYVDELVKALQDKSKREKIKKLTLEGDPDKVNWVAKGGWYNFTIMDAKKNTDLIGRMFCDLAQEQGREEFDIAADLFIEEKSNLIISLSTMSEEDVQHALKQPWVMVSSDGAAVTNKGQSVHPRNYGSFSRVLRKYVREEALLSLVDGVRKMTSLPAQLLRLSDRGLLLKGYKADLVVFDPEKIKDNATFLDPHQYASGVEYVIVNGEISIDRGKYNNSLHGKALLHTEN
ncbi:amidohydrolase family protein [Acidobacteriota bacterium]